MNCSSPIGHPAITVLTSPAREVETNLVNSCLNESDTLHCVLSMQSAFVTGLAVSTLRNGSSEKRTSVRERYRSVSSTRSRRSRAPMCSTSPMLRAATGKIVVLADIEEIAVGDTLMIEYTADAGSPFLEEDAGTVLWTGGFNGWRGEETKDDDDRGGAAQTLNFPFVPLLDGHFRVSVIVPDYARSIDFVVSSASGYIWDDNSGNFYTIPIKYRKHLDRHGEVESFVANAGLEIKRDAKVELNESPVLMPEVESNMHRIRGEAAIIGEEKGLGNILVSQARDTFERYDYDRVGLIDIGDVSKALKDMAFDLENAEVDDLLQRFVKNEHKCSMVEWILIYAELELSDHGIQMV